MTQTDFWIVIFAAGFGTFCLRYSFILFAGVRMPPVAVRLLRFVPAGVLSALVAPAILRGHEGSFDLSLANAHLPAALVAGLIAWRTKNMITSLAAGMCVLWLWQWAT